jgi:hypothetical protein
VVSALVQVYCAHSMSSYVWTKYISNSKLIWGVVTAWRIVMGAACFHNVVIEWWFFLQVCTQSENSDAHPVKTGWPIMHKLVTWGHCMESPLHVNRRSKISVPFFTTRAICFEVNTRLSLFVRKYRLLCLWGCSLWKKRTSLLHCVSCVLHVSTPECFVGFCSYVVWKIL